MSKRLSDARDLEKVRRLVRAEFAIMAGSKRPEKSPRAKGAISSRIREEVLSDRGRPVARSFRAGDLMAIWFLDYGFVQFYDSSGNLAATVDLTGAKRSLRRVA